MKNIQLKFTKHAHDKIYILFVENMDKLKKILAIDFGKNWENKISDLFKFYDQPY
jgi:hypothetical protein